MFYFSIHVFLLSTQYNQEPVYKMDGQNLEYSLSSHHRLIPLAHKVEKQIILESFAPDCYQVNFPGLEMPEKKSFSAFKFLPFR